MLGVPGPHDAGVVVDDEEVGVVGQPADGKYCYDNIEHLDNLKQQEEEFKDQRYSRLKRRLNFCLTSTVCGFQWYFQCFFLN